MPKSSADRPHFVDIAAGRNLRIARTQAGMSQSQLGQLVGITFQQIQKYESGRNRMSLSRAYEFARILNVAPADFFAGVNSDWPHPNLASMVFDEWLSLYKRATEVGLASELGGCVNQMLDIIASGIRSAKR